MRDSKGCSSEQGGLLVEQSVPMNLDAGEDATVQYGNEFYNLQVTITVDPSTIVSVVWQEDGVTICEGTPDECFEIEVDPFDINTYCVTLTDIYGCESTDCVTLEEELQVDVYFPNIFDPTSLSNNSRFYAQSGNYVSVVNELRIYDRWGNLIWEAEAEHEPNNPDFGWDGLRNGKIVLGGIYVYMAVTTDVLGEQTKHSGDIMLLK